MKAFVITIMNHQGSLESSWRCIEYGLKYNLNIKTVLDQLKKYLL